MADVSGRVSSPHLPNAMNAPLICRICGQNIVAQDAIDIFSEDSIVENIAPKILYTLAVMITEHDPSPKHICKECYGYIDLFARFVNLSRVTNSSIINNYINIPRNSRYRDEMFRFLDSTVENLFYRQHSDIKSLYDSVLSSMRNSNPVPRVPSLHRVPEVVQRQNNSPANVDVNEENNLNAIPTPPPNMPLLEEHVLNAPDNVVRNEINLENGPTANNSRDASSLPIILPGNSNRVRNEINLENDPTANNSRDASGLPIILPGNSNSVTDANHEHGVNNESRSHENESSNKNKRTNTNGLICTNGPSSSKTPSGLVGCSNSNELINTNGHSSSKISSRTNNLSSIDTLTSASKNLSSVTNTHGLIFVKEPSIANRDSNSRSSSINGLSGTVGPQVIDEVICLDDDDDDDVQIIEDRNISNVLKSKNNNNNKKKKNRYKNNKKVKSYTFYNCRTKNNSNKLVFSRKLVSVDNQNIPPANFEEPVNKSPIDNETEMMTVTPDFIVPNTTATDIFPALTPLTNKVDDMFCQFSNVGAVETSQVTANTGFHFLYEAEQMVDLTVSEECSQKLGLENLPQKVCGQNSTPSKVIAYPIPSTDLDPIPSTSSEYFSQMTTLDKTAERRSDLKKKRKVNVKEKNDSPPRKNLKIGSYGSNIPKSNNKPIVNTTSKNKIIQDTLIPTTSKKCKQKPTSHQLVSREKSTNDRRSRPKRASAIAAISEITKKRVADVKNYKVKLIYLQLSLYQCPICQKYFESPKVREKHELGSHKTPSIPTNVFIQSVQVNAIISEQEKFLSYFNLGKNSVSLLDRFASRKNFQKSLNLCNNVRGTYKCHYCEYKTSRTFILWAHMTIWHANCTSDTKPKTLNCFMCQSSVSYKLLLKHLSNCIQKEPSPTVKPPIEKLSCDFCDVEIKSLAHLEEHLWDHA